MWSKDWRPNFGGGGSFLAPRSTLISGASTRFGDGVEVVGIAMQEPLAASRIGKAPKRGR